MTDLNARQPDQPPDPADDEGAAQRERPPRPDVRGFQEWLRARLRDSGRSARSISARIGRQEDYLGQFLASNPETARTMPGPQEIRVIIRELGGSSTMLLDALRFWGVDPDDLEADMAILAARRSDEYSFKRLPPEAIDEIRAFIATTKAKYLQRQAEVSEEGAPASDAAEEEPDA